MKKLATNSVLNALVLLVVIILPQLTKAQPGPAHAMPDTTTKKWTVGIAFNTQGNGPLYTDPNNYYNGYYYGYYNGYYPYTFNGNTQASDNSFSFSLKGNCCYKKNLSLKYLVGMRSYNYSIAYQDSGAGSLTGGTTKELQRSFYASIGCQQDIHVYKMIYLFAGLDFTVTYYTNFTQTSTYTNPNYNPASSSNILTLPGGFSFGLGPVIGFTLRMGKHIGVGAEVTRALLYQDINGNQTQQVTGAGAYSSTYTYKSTGWTNSGTIVSINLLYIH